VSLGVIEFFCFFAWGYDECAMGGAGWIHATIRVSMRT
jgi:hypothetical protein